MESIGIAAAKFASTMVTRPLRVNAAGGSGPALNPVKFTPGPHTQMGRAPLAMPAGL